MGQLKGFICLYGTLGHSRRNYKKRVSTLRLTFLVESILIVMQSLAQKMASNIFSVWSYRIQTRHHVGEIKMLSFFFCVFHKCHMIINISYRRTSRLFESFFFPLDLYMISVNLSSRLADQVQRGKRLPETSRQQFEVKIA